MADGSRIDGVALATIGAGSLLLYAAVKGKSVLSTLQGVVQGKSPATATAANQIEATAAASAGGSGIASQEVQTGSLPAGGSSSVNEGIGRLLAAKYGWATGQNWQALNYGWGTLESGWNDKATNPGSGAFGIAQALGHGNASTQGTLSNAYGPVGSMSFSNSLYVAANSGNASAQIEWGLKYIEDSYGSPSQVPGWLGQSGYEGY